MTILIFYVFLSKLLPYLNLAGSISVRVQHAEQKDIASKNYEQFHGCLPGCKAVMYCLAGMVSEERSKSMYVRMRGIWKTYNECTRYGLSFVPSWIICR